MSARVLLVAAALLTACASASPPSPAPPRAASAPGGDPSVAECLATAGATRARSSGEPAKVGVRHLLVKYKGAARADAAITRTREQACVRALEARDKVRGGADFVTVV